jgi:DNA processing protein
LISQATYKLLVASKVGGVGRKTLLDLAANRLFFELEPKDWHLDVPALKNFLPSSSVFAKAMNAAEKDVEAAEAHHATILSSRDPSYPKLLEKLSDRPGRLYVRGDVSLFTARALGLIGTREPSEHGRITAHRIGTYFAERGWQIVSGLAVGLDTVGHEAALQANGSTVAVLAHGLDIVYPKKNAELAARILDTKGLLVSEYPFGTPSLPNLFVERDRIQAALSRGMVMVQTGQRGGSWHASRAAIKYGRRLAVPRPTNRDLDDGHPKMQGNRLLIESSAAKKAELLLCSIEDLSRLFIINSRDDYPHFESLLMRDGGLSIED